MANIEIQSDKYIKDGSEYARITSVLGTIPKPALDYWKSEKVALGAILGVRNGLSADDALKFALKAPEETSKDARDQGTTLHELIKTYNLGGSIALKDITDPTIKKKFCVWMDFRLHNEFKPLMAERTIFSDRYKIAGTLDHYGFLNGVEGIDDFKTGGVYDSHFVQLAAYNEMLIENGATDKDLPLRVLQITEEEVIIHTPETFFQKGGKNKDQACHIPNHQELFLIFRCALFMWRFSKLKVGKHEHLVKSFSELAEDTSKLLKAMEGLYV